MIIFPHYEPHQISGWDISCHFGLKIDDIIEQSAFTIEETSTIDDGKIEYLDDADEDDYNERDSSLILLSDNADQEIDKAILLGCLGLLKVEDKLVKYGGHHLFNPAGACYKMDVADKYGQLCSMCISRFTKLQKTRTDSFSFENEVPR